MSYPAATHFGKIKIGTLEIPVAVLKDGTRLITQSGIHKALGKAAPNSRQIQQASEFPTFLSPINLRPFVDQDLVSLITPIRFIGKGSVLAYGYRAECFPKICEVYLKARDKGCLALSQENIAVMADIIIRSIATVGIISLVDEATGYQSTRDRDALQKILELYISKELLPWTKRFPDEFYTQIFRLKGWKDLDSNKNRPSCLGKFTGDIVYDRIAPDLLNELKNSKPPEDTECKKVRLHQRLTRATGIPALDRHLAAVIAVMKLSNTWEQFLHQLNIVFPKPKINMDGKK